MAGRWWKHGSARIDLDEVVAVGVVGNNLPGPDFLITVTVRGGHDVRIGADEQSVADFYTALDAWMEREEADDALR